MDLNLNNKTALVTASSGGIGLEIARSLASEGARVIVNGRTQANVDKAIEQLAMPGAQFVPLVADNGTEEGAATTIAQVPEVDILVNNLGIYEAVGFFDEDDDSWQRLFDVNIMSGVRLARHYLKGMLARGHGRVVFISSESAVMAAPEMTHYTATKTMQLGISRSLAELTKGTEVTVNSVLPGPTRTENLHKFIQDVFPEVSLEEAEKRFMSENRPSSIIDRLIGPKEIGDIVAFLASQRAAVINGASIRAEGGTIRGVF